MKKNIFKSTLISILLFTSSNVFAECRFYAAISQTIASENIQNHLLKMPNSLKFLGRDYDNGWSVGFYTDKDIRRIMQDAGLRIVRIKPLFILPATPLSFGSKIYPRLWITLDKILFKILPKRLFCRSWLVLVKKA